MNTKILMWLWIIVLATSCYNPGENSNTQTRIPVYFSEFKIGEVQYNQKVQLPNYNMGKLDAYILVLEPYKGVHLLSDFNADTSEIFWDFAGITDFTIAEKTLTFKMMKDVFTIDISNEKAPKLISKITTSNIDVNSLSPFRLDGSFECVVPSKGYIKTGSQKKFSIPNAGNKPTIINF
ncbi:MAG: hypothetical protein IPO48_13860 [Saprospiraceae bacterium]|nr:hypothetical protein [Saprospiraceae bacterium]